MQGGDYEADQETIMGITRTEIIKRLVEDLEAELNGKYDKVLDWPSMKRNYDRDMENVYLAKRYLNGIMGT